MFTFYALTSVCLKSSENTSYYECFFKANFGFLYYEEIVTVWLQATPKVAQPNLLLHYVIKLCCVLCHIVSSLHEFSINALRRELNVHSLSLSNSLLSSEGENLAL